MNADDKKRARLNCITHLLSLIDYQDLTPQPVKLTSRNVDTGEYARHPLDEQTFIPEPY